MMGYIVYFHLMRSDEFVRSPYNQRQDSLAERIVRGKTRENGKEYREYPYGDMFAHVVGYTARGKTGIEAVENSALLTSNAFFLEKIQTEFKDQKNIGDNVVTTLDVKIQEAAYDALGSSKGAVVAIEPSTGKILAMVSKPDFDPNTVSEEWEDLSSNDDGVLVNRATQGQYAPGSTFKLVTALEYMREDKSFSDYSYKCRGEIKAGSNTIRGRGSERQPGIFLQYVFLQYRKRAQGGEFPEDDKGAAV